MAKKSKGINLLNGISGTKLASLIAVIAIILAIPVTTLSLQKQQQIQQQAAISANTACKNANGTCMESSKCSPGRAWDKKTYCGTRGTLGIYCCILKPIKPCYELSGVCINSAKYSCGVVDESGSCSKGYSCCTGKYSLQ
jgi:hypothetical protein